MKNDNVSRVYLDEYLLQRDMRIRMPKEIVKNLHVKPGETFFEIYLDSEKKEIILSIRDQQ